MWYAMLHAAVAAQVALQADLTDAVGQPLHGQHTLTFALAEELPGGAIDTFWTEDQSLALVDGAFSAFLGAVVDVPAARLSAAKLYVQVAVDGGPPTPLLPVGWAPRAVYAAVAGAVSGPVDAAQLTGTLDAARLPSTAARTTGATFTGAVSGTRFSQSEAPSAANDLVPKSWLDAALLGYVPRSGGSLTGALSGTFTGDGTGLSLSASQLGAGTVPDERLAATVARTTGATFTGAVAATGAWPQLSASPPTGDAYLRANRASAATGEAGVVLATGGTGKWWIYLNDNDDATLRFHNAGDKITFSDAGDGSFNGSLTANDVNVRIFNIRPSIGAQDFWAQTAFAVCAARHSTFRYLERKGSGSCAAKCADSESPEAGACLGAYGLGGNVAPWTDNGCAATASSIQYCCCSW